MQASTRAPDFKTIALKWHDLAERRLDYYTELYRSGRWKHYYTQERFAIRMLEVIEAAKVWRALAGLPREKRPDGATGPATATKSQIASRQTASSQTSSSQTVSSPKPEVQKPESPARRAGGLRTAA